MLFQARVDGKVHAIPIQAAPTAEKFKNILVRTDFMQEAGITDIKSIADMEAYYEAVLAKHPEMKFVTSIPPLQREFIPFGATTPLITGYVDFDKNYPKAVEALKAAGIESYVAEFQKQLDAYMAK